jgi:N-acetyl sugar amidotransferase
VCSGCRVHEEKDELDWGPRAEALGRIFDQYRSTSGQTYDCIVPVSGGKDSHFIVSVVKERFGMNPLLVTYNHEYNTKRGIRNLANLLTEFDCDQVSYTIEPDLLRRLTRHSLRKLGTMYWHVQAGTLTFPVQVAVKFKIPLIVWGVHGWSDQVGMFSHLDEVEMTKKIRKEHALMRADAEDMVDAAAGISRQDIQPFVYPYDDELEQVGVRGVYLGNYIRWDSKKQHELMIARGYETAPQARTFNTYEDVDCWHSAGTHDYAKFLKWGYGKATDHACREIRLKRMTREEGIGHVERYEQVVPPDLPLFLKWAGLTEGEFYDAMDRHRDPRVWRKDGGRWTLLDSVTRHANDPGVDVARLEKVEECRFVVTPAREPDLPGDEQVLMGRGYLDARHQRALDDGGMA